MSGVLDSFTASCTFGSIGFWTNNQGQRAITRPARAAVYKRDDIPYSQDRRYLQKGGAQTKPYKIALVVKGTDYAALDAALNVTDTLTIVGAAGRSATLVDLDEPRHFAGDYYLVSATWEF